MHPRTGGRVVLDLVSDGPTYRAALLTPEARWDGEARVGADGAVAFSDWVPADPPPWLVDLARAFLRGEWRYRHGAATPSPWPARINRWRSC
jgi:hypothetical protein